MSIEFVQSKQYCAKIIFFLKNQSNRLSGALSHESFFINFYIEISKKNIEASMPSSTRWSDSSAWCVMIKWRDHTESRPLPWWVMKLFWKPFLRMKVKIYWANVMKIKIYFNKHGKWDLTNLTLYLCSCFLHILSFFIKFN